VSTYREREDTYDIPGELSVTDALMPLVDDSRRIGQQEHDLENVYFDTADGDLLRQRITLRRRQGGSDSGWQLKVPAGAARTEIHVADAQRIPDELADLVAGVARGRELHEVARLQTHRVTHLLLDERDAVLVDVDDDTVRVTTGDGSSEWREVEVELGERGDERLLAAVSDQLRRAGATPSPYPSKLARALSPDDSAGGEPLSDYLRTQYERLIAQDVALRRGDGDVHKARVANRRLRSTLRTFRPLFQPGSTQPLEDELRRHAGQLGEVRDREVLRGYLDGAVRELPAELILGPVRARIGQQLQGDAVRARAEIDTAIRSESYLAFLDKVERFVRQPPLRADPAPKQLRKRAGRAARRTMRRLDRAVRSGEGAAADLALHRARKAAKRARYAAELIRPVAGKRAKKQARRFQALQDVLGEHQDSVVTAQVLHEFGARAGSTAGENGFTYGLLFCRERQRAARTREQARCWLLRHG